MDSMSSSRYRQTVLRIWRGCRLPRTRPWRRSCTGTCVNGQYRILLGSGGAEDALGADMHSTCATDHTERAVGRGDSGKGVALKMEVTPRVDEIRVAVHPPGVCAAKRDGIAPFHFLGKMIGECETVTHGAVALARSGGEARVVDEAGFARPPCPNTAMSLMPTLSYSRVVSSGV